MSALEGRDLCGGPAFFDRYRRLRASGIEIPVVARLHWSSSHASRRTPDGTRLARRAV